MTPGLLPGSSAALAAASGRSLPGHLQSASPTAPGGAGILPAPPRRLAWTQVGSGWCSSGCALSDRWGRRPLIVAGMTLQAVALWAILLVHGEALWIAATLVLGLGTSLAYPTLIGAVNDVAVPTSRASVVGVYRLWRDLGDAVGALLSGIVADVAGIRSAIILVATLTVDSALITAWRLRETLMVRAPPHKEAREVEPVNSCAGPGTRCPYSVLTELHHIGTLTMWFNQLVRRH